MNPTPKKQKILILLDKESNLKLLCDVLEGIYDIQVGFEVGVHNPLDFDLCIADGVSFDRMRDLICDLKAKAEPLFLPVLLLGHSIEFDSVPTNIRDLVDEFLKTPTRKSDLLSRVAIALLRRKNSVIAYEMQEQLKQNIANLESERELRERFVATLTHDLRTPLTSAKLNAQLLRRKSVGNDGVVRLAQKIADSMDRADDMIRDLLDANLIKAGENLPVEIEPFELNQVIVETIEELSNTHGERFTYIRKYTESHVEWSRSGFRRILENLCNNAVKYGENERKVVVEMTMLNDCVEVKVQNFGNPILGNDLESLFDPFRRGASAHTGRQKGWGLGLTLVRGITLAHGGIVRVRSSKDDGTIFSVVIPRIAKAN